MRQTFIAIVWVLLIFTGCSFLKIHPLAVNQGNIFSKDKIDQIKYGMNRDQVAYLLGTPMVTDPFDLDVWGYYYSISIGKSKKENRLFLYFKDDKLVTIKGTIVPKNP